MGLRQSTVAYFEGNRNGDYGAVLGGGAAKCKELDSSFYDRYEAVNGRGSVRRKSKSSGAGMQVMEADWLATPTALYYINATLLAGAKWDWDLYQVTSGTKRLRFRQLHIAGPGGTKVVKVGETSAQEILRFSRQFG